MNPPVEHYIDACLAGDLAAHVAALSLEELKALHSYAAARVVENEKKGGVPAMIKWACVLEAAARILTPGKS
jgi:hypothetical protein